MSTYEPDKLYYLAVRPISERASDATSAIQGLFDATGIEKTTLVQKFTGPALQILKSNKDKDLLDDISRALLREGLRTAIISRDDIRPGARAERAASIDISANKLTFLSATSDPILTLDDSKSALLVLGSLEPEKITSKRLVRGAMGNAALMPVEELIDFICMNDPILDVYTFDSPVPTRIEAERFNYSTLGELNRNSTAINLKVIIGKIMELTKASLIDTGFGQSQLPFVTIERETTRNARLGEFDAYSKFISLAACGGIFKAPDKTKGTAVPVPIFSETGRLMWGGPLLPTINAPENAKSDRGGDSAPPPLLLPTAPTNAAARKSGLRLRGSFFGADNLRSLGPRLIVAPLVAVIIAVIASVTYLERTEPIPFGVLATGLLLFTHSFVLLKRKRSLENCPTAKIGTMPMGEVEVYGRARSKYRLRAPYSLTDCVYYSYKVYEVMDTSEGVKRTLKEWGSSEHVPFYLEDETGTVTITPSNAIIHAGRTDTINGDALGGLLGSMRASGAMSSKIVVETVVPIGSLLFVTGYADRTRDNAHERKKNLIERLRHLKSDPAHVKKYDADNDGKLNADEWEIAKRDAEEAIMTDSTTQNEADRVAVGEHPTGGLFYISDKKEEHIISSIAWRIPVVLALGIATATIGAVMLLQLIAGKGILGGIVKFL